MEPIKDNWLERWKRNYDDLSSEFALRRFYSRNAVDYIYTMLMSFWGSDFFDFDFLELLGKNELHFIQSLVFRPTDATFYRLLEACFLIDYAQTKNQEQYQRLVSFKGISEKVRDTLCELLIEFAFNEAGLKYEANPVRGSQTLEGYCELNGDRFLVECKNKYSMNKDEFKVICSITARLMEVGRKITAPNMGVGYIYFKSKNISEHQTHKVIGQLEGYLLANQSAKIDGGFEDDYLKIELKPGTEENYKEFDSGVIKSNIYFSVKPTYKFDVKDNLIYNMHVGHRSSASQADLSKRLIRTISDARKQHKDDTSRGRVFCIFNEFLNDFRPPLLVNSVDYVKDVSRYLSSKKTDDIVILVDRSFNLNIAMVHPHITGQDHLLEYKKRLSTIDFSVRRIATLGV